MENEVRLKNGSGTGYGLGLQLGAAGGHRVLAHGGEVSGFTAQNSIYPDDKLAVVVLTNQDANGAAGAIARQIANLLLAPPDAARAAKLVEAEKIFIGLQHGKIDRSLFTDNANAYFTPQALDDFASSLGPLGEPVDFTASREQGRGGMVYRGYTVTLANKMLRIIAFEMPDGKLEQFIVSASN
jgi:hypothetical protein